MGYGTPMQNQNKGYAAQEKKDLLGDMPIDKVASGGSWMSKHVTQMGGGSPLMAAKPDYIDIDKDGDTSESMKEAAKGASPAEMNQAPTMKKGSMAYKQGYNARLDESLGTKNGKKSQSLKDRRDESKGMEKSKGKGAYSSDSQMS